LYLSWDLSRSKVHNLSRKEKKEYASKTRVKLMKSYDPNMVSLKKPRHATSSIHLYFLRNIFYRKQLNHDLLLIKYFIDYSIPGFSLTFS
jgi:hypothetical protein